MIKTTDEMVSINQLHMIMPYASHAKLQAFGEPLNNAMNKYSINTVLRKTAFIAQIAHESGSLNYTKEIASGKAYEGRKDLGNTVDGYGVKYKGRGLIQITGFFNYKEAGKALGVDLVNHPDLLEGAEFASMSAAWWWSSHGLNELADQEKFSAITKVINGGYNGIGDREGFYKRAKKIIK